MDQVSAANSARMIDGLNKIMTVSNIKMTQMAEKLMKAAAGTGEAVGLETGKGENIDLSA